MTTRNITKRPECHTCGRAAPVTNPIWEHIRHRPWPQQGHQRTRIARGRAGHGVQAHRGRPGPLAHGQRTHLVAHVRGATSVNGKLVERPDETPDRKPSQRSSSRGLDNPHPEVLTIAPGELRLWSVDCVLPAGRPGEGLILTEVRRRGRLLRSAGRGKVTIMELGLTGKRVVVTGAGKGIGLAITRGFAAAGAHVVAGSRHASAELKELANQGDVTPVEVDLAASDGPARLVAVAGDRVDVLVNNVGIAPPRPGGFLAVTDDSGSRPGTST